MDVILNRKSLTIISLGFLLLLILLWMRPLAEGLSTQVVSMTPLESMEAIIQQAIEENSAPASGGGNLNRPNLREEIEQAKGRLSKSDYKAAKSNYQRMAEHIRKLENYKKDPYKFDNQGFLRNAPNEQARQKIIESRIAHLEQEIQAFYNNILKIIHP